MNQPNDNKHFEKLLASLNADVNRLTYMRLGREGKLYKLVPPQKKFESEIVMLHGAGNHALFPLVHYAAKFLELGYTVQFASLDGHGCSPVSFSSQDLASFVEELFHTLDSNKTYQLFGFSLGSLLFAHYLQLHQPSHVNSFTAIGMPIEVSINILPPLLEPLIILTPSLYIQMFRYYHLNDLLAFISPRRRLHFPIQFSEKDKHPIYVIPFINAIKSLVSAMKPEQISCPSLFVHGKFDFIAKSSATKKFSERVPNVEFHSIIATHFSSIFSIRAQNKINEFMLQNSI